MSSPLGAMTARLYSEAAWGSMSPIATSKSIQQYSMLALHAQGKRSKQQKGVQTINRLHRLTGRPAVPAKLMTS